MRREWGCGWDDEWRGNGTAVDLSVYASIQDESITSIDVATLPPEYRTCPWYFDASPFVASVADLLGDYEEGRLGDARELSASLRDYLRTMSDARQRWTRHWQDEL